MQAAVVGAGILGQLLALSLINAGWQVSVFDGNADNSCSRAAAGLLTPLTELEKNEVLIFQMGIAALQQHWPNILRQLNNKVYFQNQGSIMLAHPSDHADLRRAVQLIRSKLPNDSFYQKLGADEIKQLEPQLSGFDQAYYFPEEGQIASQELLDVLSATLIDRGVSWFSSGVVELQPGKLYVNHQWQQFDLVLDCRGLGAKNIFKQLRGIRGELIWLEAPEVKLNRPIRLMHPRYSLYLVPRPQHLYLVGASEIEATDFSPISLRATLELLTAVYSINASFLEARIVKTVTQCRPALADHLPRIKYTEGLLAINGLYRHGYLIAPTLAYEITHWLSHGKKGLRYPELWEEER